MPPFRALVVSLLIAPMAAAEDSARIEKLRAEIAALEAKVGSNSPEFEEELHAWQAAMALPVDWTLLAPIAVEAKHGTTLAIREDGSIRASGTIPDSEEYTLRVRGGAKGVTAFRIEALTDYGHAERATQVVADFTWRIIVAAEVKEIGFAEATASGDPRIVILPLKAPVDVPSDAELCVTLRPVRTLGSFRISTTDAPGPVCAPPERIAQIFAIEPSERTDGQRAELANYFRPRSKTIARLQAELAAKEADLAAIVSGERH